MNRVIDVVLTVMIVAVLVCIVAALVRGATRDNGEAELAAKMCADSGGTLLLTEYSSDGGIVLNCFYPAFEEGEDETIPL
jgi:putative hemolysin